MAPFALLVAFDGVLSRTACRAALPLLIGLDGVYAWNLIPRNLVEPGAFAALLRALQ